MDCFDVLGFDIDGIALSMKVPDNPWLNITRNNETFHIVNLVMKLSLDFINSTDTKIIKIELKSAGLKSVKSSKTRRIEITIDRV